MAFITSQLKDFQSQQIGISTEERNYADRFSGSKPNGYWAEKSTQPINPLTKRKQTLSPQEIISSYTKDVTNTKTSELSSQEQKLEAKYQKMLLSFRSEKITNITKQNDIENLLRDYVLNKQIASVRRKIFIALEAYIGNMHKEFMKLANIQANIQLPTSSPPIKDLLSGFKACENMLIREANYAFTQNQLNPSGDKKLFYQLTSERRSEIILDKKDAEKNANFIGTSNFSISTEDLARQNRSVKRPYPRNRKDKYQKFQPYQNNKQYGNSNYNGKPKGSRFHRFNSSKTFHKHQHQNQNRYQNQNQGPKQNQYRNKHRNQNNQSKKN